jgi:mannose-6-phosphate isomerase-like protein (cupin superfamily)
MDIEYHGDPLEDQRPPATVQKFEELRPTVHEPSPIGADTDYLSWEYSYPTSRWYDEGELLKLEPGEYTDFHSHREGVERPYEKRFCVFSGSGVLRTERSDERLEQFDSGLVPPDAAYQFGNTGTEALWIGWWASVGDADLSDSSELKPSERPGALEEYQRIMAARSQRDLPTSPSYDEGDDGSFTDDRPVPTVKRFSEIRPNMFRASPQIAATEDRPDWIYSFSDSNWIEQNTIVRLDPGTYIGFHAHFENEGPAEEIYWVLGGKIRLETEYRDMTLHEFDCAYFPTGCMHTMGNVGTERAWISGWYAKGGHEGEFNMDDLETSERPGMREEFERVMAARKERGLPLPPHLNVDIQ